MFTSLVVDVTGSVATGGHVDDQSNVVSEEDELQRAIQVSMPATKLFSMLISFFKS